MNNHGLPDRREMVTAFLASDSTYDGIFFTAVKTTGIFCRPSCKARKPKPENVEFFAEAREALLSGFRPCKRCQPLLKPGSHPEWIIPLLREIDGDPLRRWRDADLRALGLTPERVRRWFKRELGMTLHAYSRTRRLGEAIGQIKDGDVTAGAAYDAGFESLSGFNEALRQATGMTPRTAASTRVVTITRIPTALGPMIAGTSDDAVCLLEFVDRRMLPTQIRRLQKRLDCLFVPGETQTCHQLRLELEEYFAGRRTTFSVEIDAPGTPFQESVWRELRKIPYGSTTSYEALARRIGRSSAVRAVARANGDNRIAILIPCHRVIGKDGSLTGYGGGLWRKRRLIDLETGAISLGL
ncbi:MAG: methylated-DNA--[protein]-cysteine S-methyltransferase [Rhodothermales bacterium]